jgi:hypothetical protein
MTFRRFLPAAVAVLIAPAIGYAQGEIKNNQPVHGTLTKPGEKHVWTVVLDRQADTLQIEAECKTTRLLVLFFKRDNVETITTVMGGQGNTVPGWGVAGNRLIAIPDPQKYLAVPSGRYTVTVMAQGGQGKGEYRLRVLSPKFAVKQEDGAAPAVAPPANLMVEISRLRDELAEQRARIVALEKKIAQLEKEKGPDNK